jgi:effector-binding domain-containing protein
MMALEPTVVERSTQPYVSIRSRVSMAQLGVVLPPLAPQVYGWLAQRGIEPAGPCFWKYNVVDMDSDLEVEVAVPVAENPETDGQLRADVLPAGKYAFATYVGHPDGLEGATRDLLAWAEAAGLNWDVVESDGDERWVARLEEYLNGPDDQPDLDKWETNLIFKIAP